MFGGQHSLISISMSFFAINPHTLFSYMILEMQVLVLYPYESFTSPPMTGCRYRGGSTKRVTSSQSSGMQSCTFFGLPPSPIPPPHPTPMPHVAMTENCLNMKPEQLTILLKFVPPSMLCRELTETEFICILLGQDNALISPPKLHSAMLD